MDSIYALSLAVLGPALFGLLGMFMPRRIMALRVWLGVAAPVVSLAIFIGYLLVRGPDAGPVGVAWMPSLQLELSYHPDRFGLFFAILVSGIGVLIALYARAYFGPDQNALYRIYPSLLLFMTGMLGLVLADNIVLMLLFWELTSISSFLLIGWERDDPAAVKNALQAFIVTGAGGMALLAGLILLGLTSGCWSFSALAAGAADLSGPGMTAAFLLIFLGAAAKSAQWPLHFWLPAAMAAPTPVSAYLHSATMVKAGVYLLGRLSDPLAGLPIWPWVLIPVGTITMVLGAYLAMRKTDLKLIFAYTTVSQLGLLVCMFGLTAYPSADHPAVMWDVTQILNHALYKAPLFILAGAIAHVSYTRDLRDLYGLFYEGRLERRLAILMLLATYAMAAGPMTLSFTAKEFFLYGAYHAYQTSGNPMLLVVLGAVVIQGALNIVIFIRFALTLLGPESAATVQPPHDPEAEEERIAYEDYHAIQTGFWAAMLWAPAALLLAIQYAGGIVPALLEPALRLLERNRSYFDELPSLLDALLHPGVPLALSGVALLLGMGLALLPVRLGLGPIWRGSIHDWHEKLFPGFYALATKGGGRVFGLLQTGNLRAYLAIICGCLIALAAWTIVLSQAAPDFARSLDVKPGWSSDLPVYAIGAVACAAALMMLFIQRRAGRVMILGTVGYGVAALFYSYSAPDLALTQISIEIVALILFLLVLGLLPRTVAAARERLVFLPRLLLAVAGGAVMVWLTLSSSLEQRPAMSYENAEGQPYAHLGEFFLRNSYIGQDVVGHHPGGGGNNVVNVILVDFRGFDTFGEIAVLGIAALGVLVLLYHRSRHETKPQRHRPALAVRGAERPSRRLAVASNGVVRADTRKTWRHAYSLSSEPLRIATKLIVPLSLLFAAFIFLKGHQLPGGGFVAGLVAAIALIAHRMAHGRASLHHMLPVPARKMIGIGLLLSLIAGVGPALLGRAFLTSRYGYFRIPGVEHPIEWTTALLFDLGVMLLVLGVVLAMINALSEESEAR